MHAYIHNNIAGDEFVCPGVRFVSIPICDKFYTKYSNLMSLNRSGKGEGPYILP